MLPFFFIFNALLASRDPSEARIVEEFLQGQGVQDEMKIKILDIIKGMGKFVDAVDCLL